MKIFPASSGGPEHLRAVRAVFPDVLLCPTGGVSLQNLRAGESGKAVAHARAFLA